MKIIKDIANPRNYTKGSGIAKEYIAVHYVGGVSSAKRNAQNLKNNQTSASAQYFVDEKSIYQTVEDSDISWGVGLKNPSGYKHPKSRNSNTINIEMCCKLTNAGVWYIEADTVKNTVKLVADLMDKHNIPLQNVLRHYDITGKHCPEPFVRIPSLWDNFLQDVLAEILGSSEPANKLIPYRVRKSADDTASQIGAYNNLVSAQDLANRNKGYKVFDQSGKLVYAPTEELPAIRTYTVDNNDSWWKIAASQMGNGLRMYELAAFNGKTIKHTLHAGNVLKIPA